MPTGWSYIIRLKGLQMEPEREGGGGGGRGVKGRDEQVSQFPMVQMATAITVWLICNTKNTQDARTAIVERSGVSLERGSTVLLLFVLAYNV